MYALYKTSTASRGTRYEFQEEASLFGCNSGWIPYFLQKQLKPTDVEPFKWSIDLKTAFETEKRPNHSLVINLKPKNKEANLSLYELVRVWGYSASGWSPIMIHVRGLFIDDDPASVNEQDFVKNEEDIENPVFSMMYLSGTVNGGKIVGRWTPPGPSPTNSVLLWPETLEYFSSEAKKVIEKFEGISGADHDNATGFRLP